MSKKTENPEVLASGMDTFKAAILGESAFDFSEPKPAPDKLDVAVNKPAPVVEEEEELEEEIDSTPADDPEPAGSSDPSDPASDIRVLADHFVEKGILVGYDPETMKDLDDEEVFEAVINTTVDARINEYKESIPEDARDFLTYLEAGGDPRKYVQAASRPDYSSMELKGNIENQKRVLRDYYTLMDLDEAQITKKIERFIDRGLLEDEAEEAQGALSKAQAKEKEYMVKQQQEQEKAQRELYAKQMEEFKSNVYSKKDIAGISVTQDQTKKLFEHMTKPVTKDGKSQWQVNLEKDPDVQLKLAYLDMINWDFSKLQKQAETKATKSLKEKLRSKDTMSSMKGSGGNASGDNFDAFKAFLK
jgi:hypothetical protein